MRSLGDSGWINDYIGLPYRLGGRDISGLDCYGLVALVYEEQFGVTLPDWTEEVIPPMVRAKTIDEVIHSGTWTDLEEPVEGCFVVCYRTRAAHHIGLYFAGGVLHAHGSTGAVFEPLSRFATKFGKIVFGEWNP